MLATALSIGRASMMWYSLDGASSDALAHAATSSASSSGFRVLLSPVSGCALRRITAPLALKYESAGNRPFERCRAALRSWSSVIAAGTYSLRGYVLQTSQLWLIVVDRQAAFGAIRAYSSARSNGSHMLVGGVSVGPTVSVDAARDMPSDPGSVGHAAPLPATAALL